MPIRMPTLDRQRVREYRAENRIDAWGGSGLAAYRVIVHRRAKAHLDPRQGRLMVEIGFDQADGRFRT